MSQGDKPGGEKKTQISSVVPLPPTVAAGGSKGFPFPAPPTVKDRKSSLGLPAFKPPTRPAPVVAPPRVPPVAAPPRLPEPSVDLDAPTAVHTPQKAPDFQRFDPLQMVDDDADWMVKGNQSKAGGGVDEGAVTGRYQPVPEAGAGLDEEGPTKVYPGRAREEREPETTVYSKVLKKPSLEDQATNRFPSVGEGQTKTARKGTMMGLPGGAPPPGPAPKPVSSASPSPGPSRGDVVTGHTQAMDAGDAPDTGDGPTPAVVEAAPPVIEAAPAPVAQPSLPVPAPVVTSSASAPVGPPVVTASATSRPPAMSGAMASAPAKKSSLGLIVGVVAGFVIVGGIGIVVATGGGRGEVTRAAASTKAVGAGNAAVAKPDEKAPAPTAVTAPEPAAPEPEAAEPGPEPQAAEPEAAAPEAAEPEAAEPEAAEPEPEAAEPEPEAAEPEPEAAEPAPVPVPPVDDSEAGRLVSQAASAMAANDHRRAYDLAAKAYELEASNPSLEIMALSACHLGENPDARSAYRKLIGKTVRRRVTDECIALGVRIHWDGEGWTSKELLKRASDALERGEYQQAFDIAQESQQKKRRSEAVALMARAMCGLKNGDEAQRYHDAVRPVERPAIVEACQKNGITIGVTEG